MYDPIKITRLLAFGTSNPSPDDYNKFVWYPAPVSDTIKPDGN